VALGALVMIVAVALLAGVALLYLRPPGRESVAFETTDVSAISVGEDVRVAGIPVGKVTKLAIGPDRVRVYTEVRRGIFIGAESRVAVRMLTPVGGYAVAVLPEGDQPLGDAVIPADHVTVPYSVADVLQQAPQVTDNLSGGDIEADLAQIAEGLKHNSASVGSVISGLNSIATVLDKQRDQVRQVADLAAEYLRTFNGSRAFVFNLLRQIDIVESTYQQTHAGFNYAYYLLGDVLERIWPEERYYLNHKDELYAAVTQVRHAIGDLQNTLGPVLDRLRDTQRDLEGWLGPQGLRISGGTTILASQICVPTPGRTC
jgi:phospholipid/cholesterol/gamma-HCH transport system substrate-binding protein